MFDKIIIVKGNLYRVKFEEDIDVEDYLEVYVEQDDFNNLSEMAEFDSVLESYGVDCVLVDSLGVEERENYFVKENDESLIEIPDLSFNEF